MSRTDKAQAVMIVVVFLAMFFLIATAFFLLSQQERLGALTHINTIRSRYIAEAGIEYAKKVLQADKRTGLIDTLGDISFTQFAGSEADLDGDGVPESRWLTISDGDGAVFGRFAVRAADESSKLNVNVCSRDSLVRLLSQFSLDEALAGKIIAARPFDAVEEIGTLLGKETLRKLRGFVTVYSREKEVDLSGDRRAYLNSANRQLILDTLTARGVDEARVKAAMLADAADRDVTQTLFTEFTVGNLVPAALAEPGDWKARDGGYYEAPVGGAQGVFTWTNVALEDGAYTCFVYGVEPGDVVGSIGGKYLRSGEKTAASVVVSGGAFSLTILPAADAPSRFASVQLTREAPGGGLDKKVLAGAEAVVINELMVNLRAEVSVGGQQIPPGGMAQYTVPTGLRPGWYTAQVFSPAPGGLAGDVTLNGRGGSGLYNGDFLRGGVNIPSDGKLTVSVRNGDTVKRAALSSVVLSQEPDCEYVEVLNLSEDAVDIGDFSLEAYTPSGELVKGWPARVPAGTVLQPYQHVILAVDDEDGSGAPSKLAGNGVSLRRQWGYSGAQLDFEGYHNVIDGQFDLLPDDGGKIVLKNTRGAQVDAVEYLALQVNPFVSIERSDPTARTDSDSDGYLDGWYASTAAAGGTPAAGNENLGMYTTDINGTLRHAVSEVIHFNRPLQGLDEVVRLSGGKEWKKFTAVDAARMCDGFAYADAPFTGSQDYPGVAGAAAISATAGGGLEWEFRGVPAGSYWLTIEGTAGQEGTAVTVSVAEGGQEDPGMPSTLIFMGTRAHYGKVSVGAQAPPGHAAGSLTVRISCESGKYDWLKAVSLEPLQFTDGRVNINTAPAAVLRAVVPREDLVQAVLNARPLGDKGGERLGVGDALLLDPGLLACHRLLTVKSDVYELHGIGQYLTQGKSSSSVDIRIILERGN